MSTSAFRFGDVLKSAVPATDQFDLPQQAPDAERISTTIASQGGNSFRQNQTISFQIPAIDLFMDCKTSHVAFRARTEIARSRFSEGIHCVVRTLKISTMGGQVLETLQDFNLRCASLAGLTIPDDLRRGALSISQGYGKIPADPANDTLDDTQYKYYVLPLTLSSIFSNVKNLPLKFLGGLRLELTLEDGNIACVRQQGYASASVPTYEINSPVFVLQGIKYNDQQLAIYDQIFRREGLTLHGNTYMSTYLTYSTQSQSLSISCRDSSIKDLMVVSRLVSDLDSTEINVNKLYKYSTFHMDEVQAVYAGNYFPRAPIKADPTMGQFYQFASDALHGSLVGFRVTPSLWSPNAFQADSSMVLGLEFESAGRSGLVSGLSTPSRQQVDIQLNVKGRFSPHQQQTLNAFINVDVCYVFQPTGEVTVIR